MRLNPLLNKIVIVSFTRLSVSQTQTRFEYFSTMYLVKYNITTNRKPNRICIFYLIINSRKVSQLTAYIFYFSPGMHVTYNMKNRVGSRVKSVTIRCSECKLPSYEPIKLDKNYTLIMPKYVANGGDRYEMIKEELISISYLSE